MICIINKNVLHWASGPHEQHCKLTWEHFEHLKVNVSDPYPTGHFHFSSLWAGNSWRKMESTTPKKHSLPRKHTCSFQVTNPIYKKKHKNQMHLSVVDPSSYPVCIQNLPRLLDEDTLVNGAHTTQRVGMGPHLHGGLLSRYSWGWGKLQGHLAHTYTHQHMSRYWNVSTEDTVWDDDVQILQASLPQSALCWASTLDIDAVVVPHSYNNAVQLADWDDFRVQTREIIQFVV